MPARIVLTVAKGNLQGQQFVLDDRTTCIVGRADDCSPRLPDDADHQTISRHHCLLDVNPPDLRIRDFGSLNGTVVNGRKIGQRAPGQSREQAERSPFPELDLKDGDEIELGRTIFRVGVFVPAICEECSVEISEGAKRVCERAPGLYRCDSCFRKAEAIRNNAQPVQHQNGAAAPGPKPKRACVQCGQDAAGEEGANRPGDFVCARCQSDPEHIVRMLLEMVRRGQEPLPGISGYEILRELGKGGFGAVYLARNTKTREQVALKVMLPKVAADTRARDIFLREAENTKALKHPNIVELRECGFSNGAFFFTMEYCDQGSVDTLLQARGGVLPVAEAASIILQALDGLEFAHTAEVSYALDRNSRPGRARGLVHRDIKPHNLFLSSAGNGRQTKVGDFGLAKAFEGAGLSGLTRTESVCGTVPYMPRQQIVNFKYSKPEVDVWATAACLYRMVTGQVVRDFPADKEPVQVILQSDAVPIRRRNPAISKKLADVIDLALRDRPSIGFRSAAEFKKALQAAL